MLVRVMQTQINEIEKASRTDKESPSCLLRDTVNRHRLLPIPELHSVVRIESSILKGARRYFEERDFVEIVVPHMTKATGACENIATMFEIDYLGPKRYLSQTGQLYLEVLTPFLNRVWCIGPSFRAEPAADGRHLTEFTLAELEFTGNFDELLQHVEGVVCSMIGCVLDERKDDLALLNVDLDRLRPVKKPFARITYTKAVELLKDFGVKLGDDLKSSHERMLVNMNDNKPLFVTHFPKAIKFFNMKENDENPETVNSADLLLRRVGGCWCSRTVVQT